MIPDRRLARLISRVSSWTGWALLATGIVALGWFWQADLRQPRELPRWDRAAFVPLIHPATASHSGRELWVIAVNPSCGHCRDDVGRVEHVRARKPQAPRLAVLIVDTPVMPDPEAMRFDGADEVWWDERGTWRGRWGHRIYGEVLCFDASGRYVRAFHVSGAAG